MASVFVEEKLTKSKPSSEKTFMQIFVGDGQPFRTNANFFCFCASLGVSKQNFIPTKDKANEVRDQVFSNYGLEGVIFSVAIAHLEDVQVLNDNDKCYEIFEGYVNGGLDIIKKESKQYDDEELAYKLLNMTNLRSIENKPFEDVVSTGPIDPE